MNTARFFFSKSCIKVCNFFFFLVIGERVMKMKKPRAINLFIDYSQELGLLSDAQTGRLIKALLCYADKREEPDFSDDTAVLMLFSVMKKQIDRDFAKYEKICGKRSESGKKGGAPKGNTNAAKQPKTSKTSQYEDEDENEDKYEDKNENKYENKYDDEENDNALNAQDGQAGLTGDFLIVDDVINYLNQKAGTHFRATAKSARECIGALLKDGYTAQDMKKAIDNKCSDWAGTPYTQYLRPETLFGKKFDSYLNAPDPPLLRKRRPGDPWYRQEDAEMIRNWEKKSLFDD